MTLARSFKMVIVEKVGLTPPLDGMIYAMLWPPLTSITILRSANIQNILAHLFWGCWILALVVDNHMLQAIISIYYVCWCCMRMRKPMTSSIHETIHETMLLRDDSFAMILWFRLHWIVVHWIVSTNTFIWGSLKVTLGLYLPIHFVYT